VGRTWSWAGPKDLVDARPQIFELVGLLDEPEGLLNSPARNMADRPQNLLVPADVIRSNARIQIAVQRRDLASPVLNRDHLRQRVSQKGTDLDYPPARN